MALERILEIDPAYDRRDPDPEKNYGIHGVQMRFVVKGEKGAIQFLLYTNWQLPHVRDEFKRRDYLSEPLPADLGYHSPVPVYEGQEAVGATRINREKMRTVTEALQENRLSDVGPVDEPTGTFTPCPYLDGKACYYDGSSLAAQDVFELMVREGGEALWKFLEAQYEERFNALQGE